MSESSHDIVKAAVEFTQPSRIPIEDLSRPEQSDLVGVGFEPTVWQWHKVAPNVEECTDLFGCIRRRLNNGIGEVCKAPLESWDALGDYQLPDVEHLKSQTEQQVRSLPDGKFVLGDMGQFLTKTFEIRGFENTLLDLCLYPKKVKDLAERLTDFAVKRIEMYAEVGGIHCVSIYDDWGTQESMLISPEQWRKLFLESYKLISACAHKNNLYTYFHSCGAVEAIITDLIEAGIDIINFDQPRLHGIAHLGEKYAGRVTFCCPVDIQATLPKRDRELVKAEALELFRHLHRNGGFIAKIYRDWSEPNGDFDAAEYSKDIFNCMLRFAPSAE